MKLVSFLERMSGIIGCVILVLLMLITFVDVVGRNFFNSPLLGAAELTQVLMASMIFLLLPGVTLRQGHVSVDLINSVAGRGLDLIRNVLTGVLGVAFFSMMAYRLYINGTHAVSYGDETTNLRIPIAPFLFGMAALAALTAVIFGVLLFTMKTRNQTAELEAAYRNSDGLE